MSADINAIYPFCYNKQYVYWNYDMYTLLMYDKKYDIIHIENHKYFGFQKHVWVLQPIGAALTCLLTISFGGGLEITQFYLTPDTVLYNGPNITLLQGRSTF